MVLRSVPVAIPQATFKVGWRMDCGVAVIANPSCCNRAVKAKEESTQVKASDFAVFVRKLPKDASEGEIKRHFSDLFQVSPVQPLQ